MHGPYGRLFQKIVDRSLLVGIVGLGYVGLPLAKAFSDKGFRVLGFDSDPAKISCLAEGQSYVGQISDAHIQEMYRKGFAATMDLDRLDEPDAVVLCLPTPLTDSREPDLSYVIDSVTTLAKWLRHGQLVVLESTSYPGTTRNVVLPLLEKSGLELGEGFFLSYSPERQDPGNRDFTLASIPKVVGSVDERSQFLTTALYAAIVADVVSVSSTDAAEACKILENTYRAVNIALVNELKMIFERMGIDIWEVIEAARTKPFGFQAFYPGPGLGGHCIPIDPFYLTWVARRHGVSTRFIELAGEINTAMPKYVIDKIAGALNQHGKPLKGAKITLLGMAYKKDADDPRESPGFELLHLLLERGAEVDYNDPFIPSLPAMRRYPHLKDRLSHELTVPYLRSRDCVVIVTDHSVYDWESIVENARLTVDTRGATNKVKSKGTIVRA